MPDSDHNETGQVTNLPRRTMSLSPAKHTGAPNMKRLSRYNLLDLRLYAGVSYHEHLGDTVDY